MTTTEKIEIMNHYINNGLVGYKDKEFLMEGTLSPYNEPIWNWNKFDYFIIDNSLIDRIKHILDTFDYDKILELINGYVTKEDLMLESNDLLNQLLKEENIIKKEVMLKSNFFIVYKNDIDISLSFLYNPIRIKNEDNIDEIEN